jgi:acyl-CoA synthetase (AMP-forming)/AMP-acid ligase II
MRVIGDLTRLNARRYPQKTALLMGDTRVSYAELEARANRLAHGLTALGVAPGDRVAILALNCPEYAVVVSAVAKCGAVLVPLNFRYRRDELAFVINDAGPRVLLAGPEMLPLVEEARGAFAPPALALVSLAGPAPAGGLTLQQATDGRPVRPPAVDVDADSPAMIMYTSGTTGFPKGVLYSHASFLGVYHGVVIEGGMRHDDVVMVTMPLFHNGGLNVLLQPALMLGATAVIMAKGFDPDATLEAVARDRVTLTMWVPTMLAMLARRGIGSHDTSSLKTLWYGSSPIAAPVLAAAREMFDAGFYQWYGQTETGMNSVLRPEDHAQRSQCTGREMFNAELRIVDGDGQDVPVGGVGEIISAQRSQGMIGYWKNEEATRATIRDGWIYTGDLARVEGDGYFTVIDRKRDMIISGAENIYPKEIEDLLVTHPAVSEVAVFGIPDDIYGESVAAAVVRKGGHEVDEQEIIAFCATRLASYKKPRRVEFVAELPKNATGKVTKHVLRAPFWPGRGR